MINKNAERNIDWYLHIEVDCVLCSWNVPSKETIKKLYNDLFWAELQGPYKLCEENYRIQKYTKHEFFFINDQYYPLLNFFKLYGGCNIFDVVRFYYILSKISDLFGATLTIL